jgi:hypothetical protein
MSTQFLLQPLSGLPNDRTPSLSPDDPNSSTIHQYIITRTPPIDGDSRPAFVEGTDQTEQPSIPVPAAESVESSVAPATLSKADSHFESQWSTEVVPKISMLLLPVNVGHGLNC